MMTLSEANKKDILEELEQFNDKFVRYKKLVLAQKTEGLPLDQEPELEDLKSKLQRKYGSLKEIIAEYGDSTIVLLQGGKPEYEAFSSAFSYTRFSPDTLNTMIDTAITAVNVAIGSISNLGMEAFPGIAPSVSPKAFIAHGGESKALDKMKEFLRALDVGPLVVEEQPSESRSVAQQVTHNLQEADCAIILGTADDTNLKDGTLCPRPNVYIEIGRVQEQFPKRTVYLLEEGASFSSNISEKIYERFTQDNMERAFIKVARELTAFGIIKAVKS